MSLTTPNLCREEGCNSPVKVKGLCHRHYNYQWYIANPERKQRMLERTEAKRVASRQYVLEYLQEHPCVDCDEDDPVVLEFDHVIGIKKADMSTLINSGYDLKWIKEEIEKCEVVCANCHRRRTARRANWFKAGELV